jgi:hypothetical protein
MELRETVAKSHPDQVIKHQEDTPMLSLAFTYHDTLYLTTELGVLGLVLWLCWLAPRLDHHRPQP